MAYSASLAPDCAFIALDQPISVFAREHHALSLRSLNELTGLLAAWYRAQRVGPRDVVAVYVDNDFRNPLHAFALASIGAIPLLLNGRLDMDVVAAFLAKIRPVGLICDAERFRNLPNAIREHANMRFVCSDAGIERPARGLDMADRYVHADNDPVLICHSSGTTGIPKGITYLHQQFFFGVRHCLQCPVHNRLTGLDLGPACANTDTAAPAHERGLSAYPQSHSAGLSFVMRAIVTGNPVLIVSDPSPQRLLHCIATYRPTTVGAFPDVYAALSRSELPPQSLQSVALWLNTGDSAHEAHIRPLVRVGSRIEAGQRIAGSIFVDRLGSSEMGFAMLRREFTSDPDEHFDRCVGVPFDFVDAQVLDPQGQPLPAGAVGWLGFRAPTITPGYWNESETTFRAQLGGYWLTGDVGMRDENGRFYHFDRAVDVIEGAEGPIYSLPLEEKILLQCPELDDAAVVGVPATLGFAPVAVVWSTRHTHLDARRLLEKLNTELSLSAGSPIFAALVVWPVDELPKGATGKVLKRLLREALRTILRHEDGHLWEYAVAPGFSSPEVTAS